MTLSQSNSIVGGDLPDWLAPAKRKRKSLSIQSVGPVLSDGPPVPATPAPTPTIQPITNKQLAEFEFARKFDTILDHIARGEHITHIFEKIYTNDKVEPRHFHRWITKDPERNAQYEDACKLRTEAWADFMIDESYGRNTDNGIPRDIQRSQLITNNLKWLMAAGNRKKYGDKTSVEVEGSISLVPILEKAKQRLTMLRQENIDDDVTDLIPYTTQETPTDAENDLFE
jgi:hypothetical protein